MIAVDTHVLVYADRSEMPLHRLALERLRALAQGRVHWGLPVFCLSEFVRVVSHPRLFDPPTPPKEALALVRALLASPSARLLAPGEEYWELFCAAVHESGASGNLVFDAQIAAVCLEHGVSQLLTADRDFARFPGLTVLPLA